MSRRASRRQFLRTSTLAGVGFWVAGGVSPADEKPRSPLERLRIAGIGIGGKGSSDIDQAGKVGDVVALCDIDDNYLDKKAQHFKTARKFNDYREMLHSMEKDIDAVTVSTPDHTHAPAAVMAMRMKKHVYCQKPLTHTVYEARLMRDTARQYGVCTQMGNQGTASDGLRKGVEIIRSGAIGPVREVHVWTNRPIWPQGSEAIFHVGPARAAALAAVHGHTPPPADWPAPPAHVHWDLFLGTAPERPYSPIYHPFAWRGWWDFGTGALGDMACHTANLAFMALKLGSPTRVTAESGEINPETYPMWARIKFEFPERGEMPAVKLVWYEGIRNGKRVLPDAKLIGGKQFSDSGSLLVGDKGVLFSPNDYGESYQLLPEKDFEGYKAPEPTLPRNGKGDPGMKEEWARAIKEGKPQLAMSNFDYAAMLTETILLGNVAMRAGGSTLDWDGPALKFTNNTVANRFIRTECRKGWSL